MTRVRWRFLGWKWCWFRYNNGFLLLYYQNLAAQVIILYSTFNNNTKYYFRRSAKGNNNNNNNIFRFINTIGTYSVYIYRVACEWHIARTGAAGWNDVHTAPALDFCRTHARQILSKEYFVTEVKPLCRVEKTLENTP